ncbi:hypothetical protein ACSBR1_001888 [Camellia fascicularis]
MFAADICECIAIVCSGLMNHWSSAVWSFGLQSVFQYPVGAHNVFMVNATGFQNCTVPPSNLAFTTGNDKIILATSGEKWYICGVGEHCAVGGQKLFINVFDDRPCSTSSTSGVTGNAFRLAMLLILSQLV